MAIAPAASSQDRPLPPARAFPLAITTSAGLASYSPRYQQPDTRTKYGFGSSLVISARGDLPLTRRLGLMGEISAAPLAKQRADHGEFGPVVHDGLIVLGVEAALAGRFKPGAPVFFAVGGGTLMASKHALPNAEGRPVEPYAGITVGYDASQFGRSNIRITYSARIAAADIPEPPGGTRYPAATNAAFDQVLQVGLRFVPSRPAVRGWR